MGLPVLEKRSISKIRGVLADVQASLGIEPNDTAPPFHVRIKAIPAQAGRGVPPARRPMRNANHVQNVFAPHYDHSKLLIGLLKGTVGMSEIGQNQQASAAAPATPSSSSRTDTAASFPPTKSNKNPLVIGVVGALLVLAAVGWVAINTGLLGGESSSQPTISSIDRPDIDAAAATLNQAEATDLVSDAKRCKVPLASISISKGTASPGSTFRIKSGSYVSPYFTVTEGIQQIAIPYPAPYGSGTGTLIVEGTASGAVLVISPNIQLSDLPNAQRIPVWWSVKSPC